MLAFLRADSIALVMTSLPATDDILMHFINSVKLTHQVSLLEFAGPGGIPTLSKKSDAGQCLHSGWRTYDLGSASE